MKTLVQTVVRVAPEHEYLLIMAPGTDHLVDVPSETKRIFARSKYYSISEQIELPYLLRKQGVDLLHAPHFVVPLRKSCPTIATIHDVIHLVFPQDIPSPLGRIYARLMMMCATRVADRIITVSEYSKQDITRLVGVDPRKVSVIAPFLAEGLRQIHEPDLLHSIRARYGIKRDYILYTGIFRERKNHAGLLNAFSRLVRNGYDLDLVISGPVDEGKATLSELAQKLDILDRLRFPGFVAESDMSGLYSGATIYACPSLYEGFGFTPLEAMACGTPVVCHNGTSLPEVCGDAALYCDARDPEQFSEALSQLLDDSAQRARMTQLGFRNIKRFSADAAANATLDLYAELLNGSQPPKESSSDDRQIEYTSR